MSTLAKKMLGRTGLEVTNLGFGAMELRGAPRGPEVSDEQAERVLNAVLDAGINYIDTSPDYGRSEDLIGRFISGRRHEYFLASKCGCNTDSSQGFDHVHTAKHIRQGVERSLERLQTDHLDLMQFHVSLAPEEFNAEGALDELLKLREEGKVRFIGVSGTLPNLPKQIAMGVFDAFQIPYSAVQREHENAIASASAAGAGVIIRGGVAKGMPGNWQKRVNPLVPAAQLKEHWETARLDYLLGGMSPAEFTLRFTLSNSDLDTTIVGTRDIDHLRANVSAALKGPLPADIVEEAKRRLDEAGSRPAD